MSIRILLLLAMMSLLVDHNPRVNAGEAALSVKELFDESILAGNAAAVYERSTLLQDDERLNVLIRWVLPSEDHATIRMNGDFSQTNPAPVNRVDATEEHANGGRIVSPVFELLDAAKRLNRLSELLRKVDAIPEAAAEEQQRAKAALRTMIQLELGDNDEAAQAADRLLQLVRASHPKAVSEMWPETLVVYRYVVRKQTAPGIDELLSLLFSQRTQLDFLPNELRWHTQIASLAGEQGHRESATPAVSSPEEMKMSQWVPISRRRALTRGQGLANSRWGRAGSQVYKISGHDDDYLFFRSPLTGDYEVQCDVTAFTTQTMTAGTFVGNGDDRKHLWVGTFRDSAHRVESDLQFSGFDDWIHQRSVVHDGICTTSLNGLVVHTERTATPLDPWYAVRNWWRMHAAARDIRITGNPVIPETVDLSAAEDLRGWYAYYYEQSAQFGYVYWNLGWSQNSKSIAFKARIALKARKPEATGFLVAVADADSPTGFAVVYDGQDHINEEFSLSPDGQQVLISLRRQGATASKLFIVDRDTPGDPGLLTGQPETWNVFGGDWSPDGKTIAFSASIPPAATEWPQE